MKYFGERIRINPEDPDPEGYVCETTPYFTYETEYAEEILCYNKTIPLCSKVRILFLSSLSRKKNLGKLWNYV